jgi:hypothetical protein
MQALTNRIARLEAEKERDNPGIAEANIRIAKRLTEIEHLGIGAHDVPFEQATTLKDAVPVAQRSCRRR